MAQHVQELAIAPLDLNCEDRYPDDDWKVAPADSVSARGVEIPSKAKVLESELVRLRRLIHSDDRFAKALDTTCHKVHEACTEGDLTPVLTHLANLVWRSLCLAWELDKPRGWGGNADKDSEGGLTKAELKADVTRLQSEVSQVRGELDTSRRMYFKELATLRDQVRRFDSSWHVEVANVLYSEEPVIYYEPLLEFEPEVREHIVTIIEEKLKHLLQRLKRPGGEALFLGDWLALKSNVARIHDDEDEQLSMMFERSEHDEGSTLGKVKALLRRVRAQLEVARAIAGTNEARRIEEEKKRIDAEAKLSAASSQLAAAEERAGRTEVELAELQAKFAETQQHLETELSGRHATNESLANSQTKAKQLQVDVSNLRAELDRIEQASREEWDVLVGVAASREQTLEAPADLLLRSGDGAEDHPQARSSPSHGGEGRSSSKQSLRRASASASPTGSPQEAKPAARLSMPRLRVRRTPSPRAKDHHGSSNSSSSGGKPASRQTRVALHVLGAAGQMRQHLLGELQSSAKWVALAPLDSSRCTPEGLAAAAAAEADTQRVKEQREQRVSALEEQVALLQGELKDVEKRASVQSVDRPQREESRPEQANFQREESRPEQTTTIVEDPRLRADNEHLRKEVTRLQSLIDDLMASRAKAQSPQAQEAKPSAFFEAMPETQRRSVAERPVADRRADPPGPPGGVGGELARANWTKLQSQTLEWRTPTGRVFDRLFKDAAERNERRRSMEVARGLERAEGEADELPKEPSYSEDLAPPPRDASGESPQADVDLATAMQGALAERLQALAVRNKVTGEDPPVAVGAPSQGARALSFFRSSSMPPQNSEIFYGEETSRSMPSDGAPSSCRSTPRRPQLEAGGGPLSFCIEIPDVRRRRPASAALAATAARPAAVQAEARRRPSSASASGTQGPAEARRRLLPLPAPPATTTPARCNSEAVLPREYVPSIPGSMPVGAVASGAALAHSSSAPALKGGVVRRPPSAIAAKRTGLPAPRPGSD